MPAVLIYLVTLLIAPQLWIPPFIGLPTDYLIFPVMLVGAVMSGRLPELVRMNVHDWLLLGFLVWVFLGMAASGMSDTSKDLIILYARCFLIYKFTVTLVGDVKRAQTVMRFFLFLASVVAIEAIQQKYSVDGAGWANQGRAWIDQSALVDGGTGRSRWIGIFDGPGVFCVMFTMALPFAMVQLDKGVPFLRKIIGLVVSLLMLWATYVTGSRGGFLAGLAVIGLYVMMRAKISVKSIIIISGVFVLAYTLAPSHLTTINDENKSTQYRVEMWAEGLDMVKEHPFLGIGRGNFLAYTQKLIAHNSAVQIGGETGLIGLCLWIGLIYVSIKGVLGMVKTTQSPEEKRFGIAMIMSVAGYLISAMFVTLEYETYYLLLALCAAVSRQVAPQGIEFRTADMRNIGAIAIAWLIGLQIFVMVYLG